MRVVTKPKPAKPQRRVLYNNLKEILTCGLLSTERVVELNAAIDARISLPRTVDGREITSSRVVDLTKEGKGLSLYPRVQTGDYNDEYMRREILNVLLTDEETHMLYDHCSALASARRTEQLFLDANKVLAKDWDGWVCDGDDYYESVYGYVESWFEDNCDIVNGKSVPLEGVEIPEFVWAARPHPVVQLDVSRVIENATSDTAWEDFNDDDLNGVPELRAALEAFVKANESVVSYWCDEKTAVLVGDYIKEELSQ